MDHVKMARPSHPCLQNAKNPPDYLAGCERYEDGEIIH